MSRLFVIANESEAVRELLSEITHSDFVYSIASSGDRVINQFFEQAADLLLLETDSHLRIKELSQRIKRERNIPIIALTRRQTLDNLDGHLSDVDDFVIKPGDAKELMLRVKRLIQNRVKEDNDQQIKHGDLIMDLARCEVMLCGKEVSLAFREYELLKFLASNPGHVFTRDILLDKVWGYDYFGGDRTVDVHIRRLRSKIEDSNHVFIETVRNIGYRFTKILNSTNFS